MTISWANLATSEQYKRVVTSVHPALVHFPTKSAHSDTTSRAIVNGSQRPCTLFSLISLLNQPALKPSFTEVKWVSWIC